MTDRRALPEALTEDAYEALAHDEARLRPGVDALAVSLGLGGAAVERATTGSLPVYYLGDEHVIKLFPQVYAEETGFESRVLAALDGELPVPTPSLRGVGVRDGWGYVLMERLPGVCLTDVWWNLGPDDRASLAAQLGELLAALHRVETPGLTFLEPDRWPAFVEEQRAGAVDVQRGKGLGEEWLRQIPGFLDSVVLDSNPRPVLLHTEVMSDHLMVRHGPDGWRLSGLYDFEPAMNGAWEYEFVAVGLYVARGDADFLRRTLLSYGRRPGDLDGGEQARRLLAYTLLHLYSDLTRYLRHMPSPAAPTLDALAEAWFTTR